MQEKQNIRLLTDEQLSSWITANNLPAYRGKQILKWLWEKQVYDLDQMTDLPLNVREFLVEHFTSPGIKTDHKQFSNDGTIKVRYALQDEYKIESVLIPVPEDRRFTACVSTQVGCSLTCKFCATGRMGRKRNLDFTEIFDQVVGINELSKEVFDHPLTNIVYMGMGEPLLNYSNTLESIRRITSAQGMGMSPSRITVSTAGIAKMIKRLADDKAKVNLALSLHAANDTKRDSIMPINDQNNIKVLMDALDYFYQNSKNRITYEYLALKDFNDTAQDAVELSRLTHRFPVKVNLIEYNSVDGIDFQRSNAHSLDTFMKILVDNGVNVTLRRSRGKDIDAACGQLANKE